MHRRLLQTWNFLNNQYIFPFSVAWNIYMAMFLTLLAQNEKNVYVPFCEHKPLSLQMVLMHETLMKHVVNKQMLMFTWNQRIVIGPTLLREHSCIDNYLNRTVYKLINMKWLQLRHKYLKQGLRLSFDSKRRIQLYWAFSFFCMVNRWFGNPILLYSDTCNL